MKASAPTFEPTFLNWPTLMHGRGCEWAVCRKTDVDIRTELQSDRSSTRRRSEILKHMHRAAGFTEKGALAAPKDEKAAAELASRFAAASELVPDL